MRRANSVSRHDETATRTNPGGGAGSGADGHASAEAGVKLAHWLTRELRTAPPKAKSLVVTVWGDSIAPHGGAVWLSTLIELLTPFGISERLTRTSVYRLAQDEWLATSSHGRRSRYRLTLEGRRRFEDAHRRIYSPPVHAWDGTWDLVMAPPGQLSSGQRTVMRRELGWQGFADMTPHVMVRPAYADQREAGVLLSALGVHRGVTVAKVRDEAPLAGIRCMSLSSRVDGLWDLVGVASHYRAFEGRFAPLVDVLTRNASHPLRPEHCFAVRTLLIHAFRRVTLHDPQLPPELLPARWPGNAAYEICAKLYRLTQAGAEAHLADVLAKHGRGARPGHGAALAYFYERFGGLAASVPPSPARRPSGSARRSA